MPRSPVSICSFLIATLLIATPGKAQDALQLRHVTSAAQEGLEFKLLEGDVGRLLDVNVTRDAPPSLGIKFFADGRDITTSVVANPPLIEIIYLFSGVAATDQCPKKLQLDLVLSSLSQSNSAYADVENTLCREVGIRYPLESWQQDFGLAKGYSRLLVIHVTDGGAESFSPAAEPTWASMTVPVDLFEDKPGLIKEVTGFVERNIHGRWSLVPVEVAPLETPLTIAFLSGGSTLFTVGSHAGSGLEPRPWYLPAVVRDAPWLVYGLGAAVSLGLAAWLLLRWRPRQRFEEGPGTPLRAISIGYGTERPYSLGEGEERDVALVVLYDSGRMRIVRKSEVERITVNDEEIEDGAWITGADKVTIGSRQFQFT